MRFPRLSLLFHRRTKSDGALAMLPPVPMATPASRPVSTSCIDELTLHEPPTDVFAPFVTAIPLSFLTSHHNLRSSAESQPIVPHLPSPYPLPNTRADPQPDRAVLVALAERNRELDTALQRQYQVNKRVPALEAALCAERAALRAARDTIAELAASVAALQADLAHSQSLLNRQVDNDHARVLAAENTALTTERLRHRKFIELMIAIGGHKPVLDRAYRDLSAGTDPEAALVTAIKEATARPDSVWATLLEPLIGTRTPEEYLAQVQCTLRARKELRDWRKRAKFWKRAAREADTHAATVTPSPSDVSSVVEILPPARQEAVNTLLEGVRNGTQPLRVNKRSKTTEFAVSPAALPTISSAASVPPLSVMTTRPSSTVLPASQTSSTVRPSTFSSSAYANLAPLASETFRASHSIPSATSRRSSIALPFTISPSFPRSVSGSTGFGFGSMFGLNAGAGVELKARRESITPSASASTQASTASTRSRRRRAHLIALEQAQEGSEQPAEEAPLTTADPVVPEEPEPVNGTESIVNESASMDERPETPTVSASDSSSRPSCTTPTAAAPAPSTPSKEPTSCDHTGEVSSSSSTTPSSLGSSSANSLSPSPQRKDSVLKSSDSDEAQFDDSDELVMVMHSDLLETNTPEAFSRSPSPRERQTPSPEKRSRLPVPVLRNLKAIRRLSISRPVLVNTTNAATFTFSTKAAVAKMTTKRAKAGADRKGMRVRDENNEGSPRGKGVRGGDRTQAAVPAGSPSRPSKIPMGQRIQQLHGDFVGSARRVVQAKTRTNRQV